MNCTACNQPADQGANSPNLEPSARAEVFALHDSGRFVRLGTSPE